MIVGSSFTLADHLPPFFSEDRDTVFGSLAPCAVWLEMGGQVSEWQILESRYFLAAGELCTDRRNQASDKLCCYPSTYFPPKTAEGIAFTYS